MSQLNERRKSDRAPIELKVEYKRLNSFFSDYTRNISHGGIFIRTAAPLEVGTRFLFRLQVPNLQSPLTLKGLVRWIQDGEPDSEATPRGMGIEFEFDSDAERLALAETVEKLMVDNLGQLLYSKLVVPSA